MFQSRVFAIVMLFLTMTSCLAKRPSPIIIAKNSAIKRNPTPLPRFSLFAPHSAPALFAAQQVKIGDKVTAKITFFTVGPEYFDVNICQNKTCDNFQAFNKVSYLPVREGENIIKARSCFGLGSTKSGYNECSEFSDPQKVTFSGIELEHQQHIRRFLDIEKKIMEVAQGTYLSFVKAGQSLLICKDKNPEILLALSSFLTYPAAYYAALFAAGTIKPSSFLKGYEEGLNLGVNGTHLFTFMAMFLSLFTINNVPMTGKEASKSTELAINTFNDRIKVESARDVLQNSEYNFQDKLRAKEFFDSMNNALTRFENAPAPFGYLENNQLSLYKSEDLKDFFPSSLTIDELDESGKVVKRLERIEKISSRKEIENFISSLRFKDTKSGPIIQMSRENIEIAQKIADRYAPDLAKQIRKISTQKNLLSDVSIDIEQVKKIINEIIQNQPEPVLQASRLSIEDALSHPVESASIDNVQVTDSDRIAILEKNAILQVNPNTFPSENTIVDEKNVLKNEKDNANEKTVADKISKENLKKDVQTEDVSEVLSKNIVEEQSVNEEISSTKERIEKKEARVDNINTKDKNDLSKDGKKTVEQVYSAKLEEEKIISEEDFSKMKTVLSHVIGAAGLGASVAAPQVQKIFSKSNTSLEKEKMNVANPQEKTTISTNTEDQGKTTVSTNTEDHGKLPPKLIKGGDKVKIPGVETKQKYSFLPATWTTFDYAAAATILLGSALVAYIYKGDGQGLSESSCLLEEIDELKDNLLTLDEIVEFLTKARNSELDYLQDLVTANNI